MCIDLIGYSKTNRARCSVVMALALLCCPAAGWAHRVTAAKLTTSIDTVARTYELQAFMDVAPSEDAVLNEEISPEAAARQFAEEYLTIRIDEVKQTPDLQIEVVEISDAATPAELQRHQVVTTQRGTFPDTAEKFLIYLDNRCPMAVVMVVIQDQKPSRRMQVILPGEYSRPLDLAQLTEGNPFELAESVPKADPGADVANTESAREPSGFAWRLAVGVVLLAVSLVAWIALRGRGNRREDASN